MDRVLSLNFSNNNGGLWFFFFFFLLLAVADYSCFDADEKMIKKGEEERKKMKNLLVLHFSCAPSQSRRLGLLFVLFKWLFFGRPWCGEELGFSSWLGNFYISFYFINNLNFLGKT